MSAYEEELRQKWNSIDYYDGGSLRLAIPHALEWYVRYASENQKSIVIVSEIPANNITSSQSIDAVCSQRRDGKYAISFTLVDHGQEDVFISMSSDIISYSKDETTINAALTKVLRRYAQWLKLLEYKRSTLLSTNAQKGLIAELAFLNETIDRGMNPVDALAGWVGPDDADQDFVYPDGWHEIKAAGASSTMITISSVEQLDSDPPGELVVYRIDKCAPAHSGAVTLYQLVHTLLSKLFLTPSTIDVFMLKLASVGYIDMKEYDNLYFVISAKKHYEVNDTFPKLCRANLPTEISNAEYQIDLPSIASWAR